MFRKLRAWAVLLLALSLIVVNPAADGTTQSLPFSYDWSNTALIIFDDDWSGVPGIVGYRGDGLTSTTAVDPQDVLAPGTLIVDVNANQSFTTFTTGGVTEFHLPNPTIALAGSGTADAPHIVININTSGLFNINVKYSLRDLETIDNAISPVALQYRLGTTGNFTNVPAAFVADATDAVTATKVTNVDVILPQPAENQPLVQLRIITTDAAGSDEWIGIDDISIAGSLIPEPTNPTGIASVNPANVAPGGTTLMTVAVTRGTNPTSDGLTVTGDLTPIGGSAAQPLFDDGTNGDVTAKDDTFSYLATVAGDTTTGTKTLTFTVADNVPRSTTTTAQLSVFVPIVSVTISQVYGGGGNSGATYTHDFIELYNRGTSPVDLAGWSVQYTSAAGATWQVTPLAGMMQPGTHYLIQEAAGAGGTTPLPVADASGTIAMSATTGKVALVSTNVALTGTCPTGPPIVDFVGYGGTANCFEGSGPTPTLSNTTAAIRLGDGAFDTHNNAADFVVGPPSPRNSSGQPPTGVGSADPPILDSGDTTLLTVAVTPGAFPPSTNMTVTADTSALSPLGSTAQPFFDDGSHGDVTAGDLTFSFSTVVTGTQGVKPITATVSDAEGRSTTTTFSVTIQPPPIRIHTIQGLGSRSPYEGQLVVTTGIVTAVRFSSFYIQTPDGEQDGDVNTSEGILVFRSPGGVAVGDLVKVSGTIVEFVPGADPDSPPITEFPNTSFVTVLSHGHPLPAPATLLPSFTSPAGNFEQLERFEGMRVTADITAVTGTASFRRLDADEINATSTSNGEFFAVLTGVARPMREPGLEPTQPSPAMPCCIPRFDGNPERLRVDSDGQTGAQKIEIVAGQTIAGLTGVLDYGFRSYTIVPDVSPWTPAGIGEAQPIPAPGVNEFTVASFNMQRFFDTLDDPGVDDLVLTAAAFEKRLSKASLAIRNILRTPDILGVEEIDNLATLQTLAARINVDAVAAGQPNPLYEAHLVEGNDPGGIDVGVLVKTARVDVVDVTQVGKDTTWVQPDGDERLLNDRPPLVLEAAIRADGAIPYAVTVIVNHLRSLSGIDGSDGVRIRAKRRAQAEFLATYIQSRQATDPSERIISVGDYNAFQVNDGYVDMIGTIKGQPTPPDQVMLASLDLVNPDLVALVEALNAEQRYSFVFDGTAQALDHVLVTQPAFRRLSRFVYARFNADFPESVRNDATRPERNSDHDAPVAYFSLPGAPIVTLNGPNPMTVEAMTTFTDPGAVATDDELGTWAVQGVGTVDTTTVGSYQLTYTATNGFLTTTVTRTVNVVDTTPPVVLLNGDASMTIELGSPFVDPGATASDTRAGDLTSSIVVSGAVNVNVVGVYTLIYSVTDGYNSASGTRTVSVVDTTAPMLSAITASPSVIPVPDHKMIDVSLAYTVSDLSGPVACSVTITSNEPINGVGDGHTTVDYQVLSPTAVRLRAERSGVGTGRIYTITVTCSDASGNTAEGASTVTVR